jgi:hypothetical protein
MADTDMSKDQPDEHLREYASGLLDAVRDVRERLPLPKQVGQIVSLWTNQVSKFFPQRSQPLYCQPIQATINYLRPR